MKIFLRVFAVVVVLLVVAAGVFLLTWDIPSPSANMEIVLPNDRFPN